MHGFQTRPLGWRFGVGESRFAFLPPLQGWFGGSQLPALSGPPGGEFQFLYQKMPRYV